MCPRVHRSPPSPIIWGPPLPPVGVGLGPPLSHRSPLWVWILGEDPPSPPVGLGLSGGSGQVVDCAPPHGCLRHFKQCIAIMLDLNAPSGI